MTQTKPDPTYEHFHIADKRYLPCGVYRRGVMPDGKIVDEAFLLPSEHNYPATIRRFTLDRFDLQLGIYELSGAREASTIAKLAPQDKETLRTRLLAQAQHVVGQPEKKTYYRLLDCKSRALGYCTSGEPIVLYDENHTARLYAPLPLTLEGFDLGWFAVDNVGDLAEFWDQVNPTIREKLRDTLQNQLPMLPMTPQKKGEPRTVTPEQVAESKAAAGACGFFFGLAPEECKEAAAKHDSDLAAERDRLRDDVRELREVLEDVLKITMFHSNPESDLEQRKTKARAVLDKTKPKS